MKKIGSNCAACDKPVIGFGIKVAGKSVCGSCAPLFNGLNLGPVKPERMSKRKKAA